MVYGWRSFKPRVVPCPDINCENCKTGGSILLRIYQRYAHICWIPFFPIGKTTDSYCQNCKQGLNLKQMPPSMQIRAQSETKATPTPWYAFSLILLSLLCSIGFGFFQLKNNSIRDNTTKEYFSAPHINDLYIVQNKKGQYDVMKLTEINKDEVEFKPGGWHLSNPADFEKIDITDKYFYSEKPVLYKTTELEKLYEQHAIYEIIRK